MSRPDRIWHVEWVDFKTAHHERRYRSAHRAAMQVAGILACPDGIARLKGVWVTVGATAGGNIDWAPVDPMELLRDDDEHAPSVSNEEPDLSALDRYERLRAAWQERDPRHTLTAP